MGIFAGCQENPKPLSSDGNGTNNTNNAFEEIKIENEITEKISLNNPFILELNDSNWFYFLYIFN